MTEFPDEKTIREMDDEELCKTLKMVASHSLYGALSLGSWERKFVDSMPGVFIQYGSLTWKQRQNARNIVEGVVEELRRRSSMHAHA